MGKIYDEIDDGLRSFLETQHVFFVATAPAGAEAHINLSPKGLDTFRILGTRRIAYLDLTGSGVETIAHLRENGRIVLMFCAFDGPPRIVRLNGRGTVVEPQDGEFPSLLTQFTFHPGIRSIVCVDLDRISDSCGYGVPLLRYEAERTQLQDWAERKGAEGLVDYRRKHNATSIDGLPGLRPAAPNLAKSLDAPFPVEFEKIEWQHIAPGARAKVFRRGSKQLRLMEFTSEFVEGEWCDQGHAGIVLSGELEIDFGNRIVTYPEGSAIFIPASTKHKGRHCAKVVRLFLVEDIEEARELKE
jgi:mannose-6-phosphate isomerase-like protein (cupin superfamily)